jgi:hypothetical protein
MSFNAFVWSVVSLGIGSILGPEINQNIPGKVTAEEAGSNRMVWTSTAREDMKTSNTAVALKLYSYLRLQEKILQLLLGKHGARAAPPRTTDRKLVHPSDCRPCKDMPMIECKSSIQKIYRLCPTRY